MLCVLCCLLYVVCLVLAVGRNVFLGRALCGMSSLMSIRCCGLCAVCCLLCIARFVFYAVCCVLCAVCCVMCVICCEFPDVFLCAACCRGLWCAVAR